MNVKQKLSVLFFLRRKKVTKDGKVPIYIRITVDGLVDELSLGCKIDPVHWDNVAKQVSCDELAWKSINKKICQAKTDIERHYDLMQAKNGVVTAAMVKESYLTPVSGKRMQEERAENLQLSEDLDLLIGEYLAYCKKETKAHKDGRMPGPMKQHLLDQEKKQLKERIDMLAKKADKIFDKEDHVKTLLLTINDYLLNFLQLSITDNRSHRTLEKWIGRKKRYQDFLQFRYKVEDIALAQLEYSFIEEVYKYLLIQHEVIENTAMKYAQCIKEMMDRAVSKGWVTANIFVIFKCRYEETDAMWPTPAELRTLMDKNFSKLKLNVIRDIYVFQCFTGLSYAEMKKLAPEHIIKGIDGKMWISMKRQKTEGDETLPILPLPRNLLRKYEHYPICVRCRRLLPVPTNEEFNRSLKDIGAQTGMGIILKTHSARYYFANEVTYNNGVELKSIGRMLGQKSMKTTEKYVKANRTKIAESMEIVERRMFSDDGGLRESIGLKGRSGEIAADSCKEVGAKIIRMPACK